MSTRKKVEKGTLAASMLIAVSGATLLQAWAPTRNHSEKQSGLRSTIAFVSTRHDAAADPAVDTQRAWLAAEIYLMDGDGSNPRRVTENTYSDGFPALSPNGTRIVFDSNRLRAEGEPFNTSDLFVMNADGAGQTSLVRGSSATWSPDGQKIAFHASASGTNKPINPLPGAATTDSDIFVMNIDDFLKNRTRPKNITNNPAAVDDDPDWSPKAQKIIFTSHAITDNTDNHITAEIYLIDADGKSKPTRLTNNAEEERAPSWSPDGKRIGFAACCEDVAVPFRVDALQDLGFALRFEIMPGRSPKSKGALLRKGKAASSQQAAKPLPKSRSEKQESKNLLRQRAPDS